MCTSMLNLSVVRGPLEEHRNKEILREFNRLTNSHVPIKDYCRWVENSPEGPAWHALLTTENSRIAGHICLIPLRAEYEGKRLVVARTEYFFVHEDFRSEKVHGLENSFLSPAILLLDQLYRHCWEKGWGPFLVSAAKEIQPFHELVGCRAVDFPLHECLFLTRPWKAAKQTPNLNGVKRLALWAVGLVQGMAWQAARVALTLRSEAVSSRGVDEAPDAKNACGIVLFADQESLAWRYPAGSYVLLNDEKEPRSYAIAKMSSGGDYLRVCQWQLESVRSAGKLVRSLLLQAQSGGTAGVRWAVFADDDMAANLVHSLRKLGFLCAARVRRLLVYSEDPAFFDASKWRLSDSLFNFDL